MNKHKQFIKDAYNGKLGLTMCSEWKEAIEETYPEFNEQVKLEVGKWSINGSNIFKYNGLKDQNGDPRGYGIADDTWYPEDSFIGWGGDFRLATDQEVKEALEKEIKKRGLWNSPIKCLFDDINWDNDNGFTRTCTNNEVWTKYGQVFKDGNFAELLETITKEEAEKQLGKTII